MAAQLPVRPTQFPASFPHRSLRTAALIAVFYCATASLTGTASAQSNSATARALFVEARALMKSDDYATACPKLEESLRLDMGMGTQFNLAHCWEKLGRTASAWALFLDVAAAAKATNQGKREAAARRRAEGLRGGLSNLSISVSQPVANLSLTQNGKALGRATWSTATPVDPGTYSLQASAPGYLSWTALVEISAQGGTTNVQVPVLELDPTADLKASPATASSFSTATQDASVTEMDNFNSSIGLQRIAGLTGMGLGVAGLAAGGVFSLLQYLRTVEANSLCQGQNPDDATDPRDYCTRGEGRTGSLEEKEDQRTATEDANMYRGYAIGGYAIGGSALVLGALLYFTADDEPPANEVSWKVAPWLNADGPQGAELLVRF